jgi:hypothetical protein
MDLNSKFRERLDKQRARFQVERQDQKVKKHQVRDSVSESFY